MFMLHVCIRKKNLINAKSTLPGKYQSVMHEGKSYSLTVEHKGFISCSLFQRYQSKSFQK